MTRPALPVLLVVCVLLAGCSGLLPGDGTPTTDGTEPATESRQPTTTAPATATTPPTPARRTAVPTVEPLSPPEEPPEPRAVATNFSHDPAVDTVYRRVETLRGVTAREQVKVEAHAVAIVDQEGEPMEPGDPFDYPDDAKHLGELQAKVLQFYSSREVPLLGAAASGFADETSVGVMNEERYEGLFSESFEALLVHEFVHTLQEQYGITERERYRSTTDGYYARLMLTEGDATLTTYRYWRQYDLPGRNPLAARNRTEPRGYWTFGFSDKTRYYGALYLQSVPADRRNDHVANPPDTTAEVMHPNQSWDLPGPAVTAPAPDDWSTASRNRVGELAVRYALRTNDVPYRRAATASTGWWNDSLRTFDRPDGVAASWATRWASEEDATEFAGTWRDMLGNLNATERDGVLTVPGTDHRPTMHYVVVTDGRVVYVAAAETQALAEAVAESFPVDDRRIEDDPRK
ncbi:hypothetical protein [Haloarchaeobius amylolyticus]|uniref:hypothetical protein n=1 Tax=Haloarchaeobius amylolyticus TaxID=1198296 RepID=UPI0022721EF4|nr:hypothetical protein [Haloarchaeobius amylolyticus]